MPDNVQPAPLLGDSEICAVMHAPFNTIPQLNKRGEDGFKCPAAVMRQQTGDIFQKKKCRPFRFSNSGNLKEQSSSRIILKSKPFSRDREALTRKSRTGKVEVGQIIWFDGSRIFKIQFSFRLVYGVIRLICIFIYFAVTDTFKTADRFKAASKTADP